MRIKFEFLEKPAVWWGMKMNSDGSCVIKSEGADYSVWHLIFPLLHNYFSKCHKSSFEIIYNLFQTTLLSTAANCGRDTLQICDRVKSEVWWKNMIMVQDIGYRSPLTLSATVRWPSGKCVRGWELYNLSNKNVKLG